LAVGSEHVCVGELGVVGGQREAAVTGGVVADSFWVDLHVEPKAGLGDLAVAGVLARSAALLLAVALLDSLGNGDGDPPLGAAGREQRGGGLLGRDAGGDPCARAGAVLTLGVMVREAGRAYVRGGS
jgi:hypothetical protein